MIVNQDLADAVARLAEYRDAKAYNTRRNDYTVYLATAFAETNDGPYPIEQRFYGCAVTSTRIDKVSVRGSAGIASELNASAEGAAG